MGYRDGLEAAQARISSLESGLEIERSRSRSLESELAAARERIAKLEKDGRTAKAPRSEGSAPSLLARLRARPEPGESRRFGAIHHHPPRTYCPFLRLWVRSVEAAWKRRPVLRSPSSDAVWRWLLHCGLVLPATYGVRLPLYFASICVALAWTGLLCCGLTVLFIPLIFLSRFSFSRSRPADESGWWHGDPTVSGGAVFLWAVMSFSLPPLLLATTSLLNEEH
ncbi:MAG: hypothetical protein HYY06_00860 [Deltaproteobacteria bacterium]|nr:hypothetical protein [Deltaproteobacteria bacterium]